MLIVRDPSSTGAITESDIRALVKQRFSMLLSDEPDDGELCAYFILVDPGDTVDQLSAQAGFSLLSNRFTGIRFGTPGFTPSFEILEEHPSCYELVFVLGDDGYGIELFVPKVPGIDPELLAMCMQYAVPAAA